MIKFNLTNTKQNEGKNRWFVDWYAASPLHHVTASQKGWFSVEVVQSVAREEPPRGVGPTKHLSQQCHFWFPRPERSLLLCLLYQCLITENCLQLITGNGYDKHSKQDRFHNKQNTVEYSWLLHSYVLRAAFTFRVPGPGHKGDGIAGKNTNVYKELNEEPLIFLPHTVIDPGTMVVHFPDTILTYSAMVSSGRPVHLTPRAYCPIFLGGDAAPFTLTVLVTKVYSVFWEGNNTWITKNCSCMRKEQ